MDKQKNKIVDVDQIINDICAEAAKYTAYLSEEDENRLKDVICSLRSGKVRNVAQYLAEQGHDLFKSNRKALRCISVNIPSMNEGLPQASVVRHQKMAYITLASLIPDSIEVISRSISRPLTSSEISSFLEKSGRRVWNEVGIDDITSDNVLHLAVSYRHQACWNENGTFDRHTIRKVSCIIDQIMIHNKLTHVRLWVDQNIHMTGISEREWYKVGLAPYLCMKVISGYRRLNQTETRPWLWVEAEAALLSRGLYSENFGAIGKTNVQKIKEVVDMGKSVSYFQGALLHVDDALKFLLSEVSCWRTRNFDYDNYQYLDEFDEFALWSAKECSRLILADLNGSKFENREPATLRSARQIWREISEIRGLAEASRVVDPAPKQKWKVNEIRKGAALLFGHPSLENVPFSVFGAVDGHSNRFTVTNEFSQVVVVKENEEYYTVLKNSDREVVFSREAWYYSMQSAGLVQSFRFANVGNAIFTEPCHYQYYVTKSYIEAYNRYRKDEDRTHNTIYGIKDCLVDFHGYIIPRILKDYLRDYGKEKEFLSLSRRATKENGTSEERHSNKKAIGFITSMFYESNTILNSSADSEFEFDEPEEIIDCNSGRSILETKKRPPFLYILCYDLRHCNVTRINVLKLQKSIRSIRFRNTCWEPAKIGILVNKIVGEKNVQRTLSHMSWDSNESTENLESNVSLIDLQSWKDIIGTCKDTGKSVNLLTGIEINADSLSFF